MVNHRTDLPFDGVQARLLPIADAVMVALLSRPPSGTLRSSRVTIATIVLAIGVCAGSLLLGAVAASFFVQLGAAWLLFELPLLAVAVASGDLAAYGVRQRWLATRT